MITLQNGYVQNAQGLIVPNGSISLQLNIDATVIAAPYGLVMASAPIIFSFDVNGNLAASSQIWSNLELNPQNIHGLGTWYTVNFYDADGARINDSEMVWQFTQVASSIVDISAMVSSSQATIYYPIPTSGGGFAASVSFTSPGLGGAFSVAHSLGRMPTSANVQVFAPPLGIVALQNPGYDNANIYLYASDGGLSGVVWIN